MKATAALLTVVLLSGCGSTVAVTSTQAGGAAVAPGSELGGGLAPTGTTPTTDALAAAPGTVGAVPGGGSVVVPGRSGSLPTTAAGLPGTAVPARTAGGVTVREPIQLGFMTTNVGNAQSAGINVGQSYSDKSAYAALVTEYNLQGGLAGRKIVPVYGDTDTAASNWNTQFEAACQKLTGDNKVKAVLGYVFVFLDSFEQCLAKKGVPHLYGGYGPGDLQSQKDFPTIVSVAHPTTDVINTTVLSGALATGRLTEKSKLGILYDGCGHGDRAFQRSTEPFLKANGISFEKVYGDCAQGSSDVSSALTTVQSAQLQFASHGVDVVYVPNSVALLFFMSAAESQGYRPQYLTQGGGGALAAQGSAPQAQLKNLHGFGWMPAIDVDAQHVPYPATPRQSACVTKLKKHGLVPKQFNDFMFAYVTCDSLDLYAGALQQTGGDASASAVVRALSSTLPSLAGTATYGGTLTSTVRQRGGPGRYRESGWDSACTCFTYRGPVRTVPAA